MKAPSYEEITSLNLNSADWRQKINEFYIGQMSKRPMTKRTGSPMAHGEMEYPESREIMVGWPGRFVFLSEIIGLTVKGSDREDLAEIENILMDSRTGHLAYAIVSYGGIPAAGEKMAAVPWVALDVQRGLEYATLNADRSTLDQVTITESDIQRLDQASYARRIHQQFAEEPYWEVFGFVPALVMSVEPWRQDSSYNRNFDAAKIETYEGTLKSVGSFVPAKGAARGLRLKVESADGKMMTVYAGPRLYARMQDIKLKTGSDVTVMGSKATIGKRSIIMASQVTSHGKTLKLRDEQGKPMWNLESLRQKLEQHKMMHRESGERERIY